MEWRRFFTADPSKEKEAKTTKDKDKVEELSKNKKTPPKEPITTELKDSRLSEKPPPSFVPKETMNPGTKTRDPKETPPPSIETQDLVDPITPTPISTKVPKHEIPWEAIPLSEYKFDRIKLEVVKNTPKWKRTLVGGSEKALIEGYKESTLWDISGPDVSHVGVETFVVITGMALIGKSSSEAMAKEIIWLKQLVVQSQNELTNNIKWNGDER